MPLNPPPADLLPPDLVHEIRRLAPEAEQLGHLLPEQLDLIYRHRWFSLFVPRSLGGLELSLPEALQLEEALARTDGSLGWTVTLCAGAGWFVGFLDPALAASIFKDPKACLAGSGQSSGIAVKTNRGYEVSGSWPHATGAHHATAFTANCRLEENGTSLIRPFLFLREEAELENNWKMPGMRATGSVGFRVARREIPTERIFEIDPSRARLPQAVYRYPFMAFAEATLAVNYTGMALRMLELSGRQDAQLSNERDNFYALINRSWETVKRQRSQSDELQESIGRQSRSLASAARRVVHTAPNPIHPQDSEEWSRLRQNMFTAETHPLLTRTAH